MSVEKVRLVVEKVTQYGFRSNNVNYSLSPKLKESGVTPAVFVPGATYVVDVYTGPKGGKSVNAYVQESAAFASVPSLPPAAPALPPTSVTATPSQVGTAPVRKAGSPGMTVTSTDEKMTKADWAAKDRRIEVQAILKSTLESPAVAQAVVGKNLDETKQVVSEVFNFALNLYDQTISGN